jgi:hypothetical protein
VIVEFGRTTVFPCIHTIAYYKLHKRLMLGQVLSEQVPSVYTYEYERSTLKERIVAIALIRFTMTGLHCHPVCPPQNQTNQKRSRHAIGLWLLVLVDQRTGRRSSTSITMVVVAKTGVAERVHDDDDGETGVY